MEMESNNITSLAFNLADDAWWALKNISRPAENDSEALLKYATVHALGSIACSLLADRVANAERS